MPVRIENGRVEILLVTTRRSGRWIIPKGWPGRTLTPAKSAAREAYEEAGVRGTILGGPVGSYVVRRKAREAEARRVEVFLLMVTDTLRHWPEERVRQRRWVRPEAAATLVDEPELARLLARAAAELLAEPA